ncbi:RNA-guided endonuclease InsQ/TnpB family protein [Paenibacillus senegalensis]|uniref:RNA-guided endonuclease InsQ/TnpB family protein n=1 Tax=Paenibacillus senegalensis TaxID=1465766 RepID=UPI0021CBAF00|nr:transposase [Paenibacillus senegalensis]
MKRKNEIIFTNLAIRRRDKQLHLSLSKTMQTKFEVKSLKVEIPTSFSLPHDAWIQQIRIQFCPRKKQWVFLIIYKIDEAKPKTSPHVMAIDLGLDNLAAITFSHHTDNYVICGKSLKAMNGYVNKEIARCQSIQMKQVGHQAFKSTKRIQRLRMKRDHFITNALHQASRYIVKLAKQYDVGTIIMGDMKGIKQTNQAKTFVQVPVQRLAKMIKYKVNIRGIKKVDQQERYTSGISALDLEPINRYTYNRKRRLKRGLFCSNTGTLVNADINGSLNIMRLYLKEQGTPKLIESVRDNGCVSHPRRIRVA